MTPTHSRQPGGLACGEYPDPGCRGHLGQAGHGDDVAADGDDKAGARREPKFVHRDGEAAGPAAQVGAVRERERRLGDAHGQLVEAVLIESLEVVQRGAVEIDAVGAVDLGGDGLELLADRRVERVEKAQRPAFALRRRPDNGPGEVDRSLAALVEVLRHHRLDPLTAAKSDDPSVVVRIVIREMTDADHGVESEQPDILDVFGQVAQAAALPEAAVVGDRFHRGDNDRRGGSQPGRAAFDVEELLRSKVGGKAGLGHDVIGELERQAGGDAGVGALSDVGEGAAVHERRRALDGLHQVRVDRVPQQHLHGADGLHGLGPDGRPLVREAHNNARHPLPKVAVIPGEAENGHDFGGGRDVEAVASRHAVERSAQADHDVPQRAFVEVDDAAHHDAARIDAQLVSMLEVVVHHGAQEVVGLLDGIHVADEVQVDVLRRHDLRAPAAGAAAFDAEIGPE